MIKIFKKISLLTIFLSLILLFNFGFSSISKAYYDWDSSYINVYINGNYAFKTYVDKLPVFIDEEPEDDDMLIALNGWPSQWMVNDYTVNEKGELLTFDKASWDLSGDGLWNSYSAFYDSVMSAFSFAGVEGSYSTDIYLWFYDSSSTSNYAELTFIVTKHGYSYEPITMTWNCLNEFTYEDFPDAFQNTDGYDWETLENGSWFIYPTSTICLTDYKTTFKGGESYTFEYWINPYNNNDSADEEVFKAFEDMVIPSVILPEDDSIKVPRYIGSYAIEWYSDDPDFTKYLKIEKTSDEFVTIIRIQDLADPYTMDLKAKITVNTVERIRSFELLIKEKGGKLEAPVVTKNVNTANASQLLSWNKVENADYYEIYYRTSELVYNPSTNSNELVYSYEQIATVENSLSYRLPGGLEDTGQYELVVVACSYLSEFYDPSDYSNVVLYLFDTDYRQLSAPVLSIEGHVLKWTAVSFVGAYELYCDNKIIATYDVNETEVDLYTLNLATGKYSFRVVACPDDYNEFVDSPYSNKVEYTEEIKGIVIFYNGKVIKTISKSSLSGVTDLILEESLNNALPYQINLSTGLALVKNYYLNSSLTTVINKDEIFDYWKAQNYCYLELYIDVIQPLVYNGPTLFYKNPNCSLSFDTITDIVDSYCKVGTQDAYILNLVEENYKGNGDKPGTYEIKYQCLVGQYTTDIILSVRVSSAIKADYIYNNKWFSSSIISKQDIILTGKAIGILPDVDLKYSIVSLHNTNKNDYYAEDPAKGAYNFIVKYDSNAGEEGIVQFEVNYGSEPDWDGEEKTESLPIETIVGVIVVVGLVVGIVIFVNNFKKNKKYNRYKRKGGF